MYHGGARLARFADNDVDWHSGSEPCGGWGGLTGGSKGDAQGGVAFCHFPTLRNLNVEEGGLVLQPPPKNCGPECQGGGGMTSAPRHARGPSGGRFLFAIERETALYFVGWDIRSTCMRPFRGLTAVRAS